MIILGLGCNIGDRLANLRQALLRLRALPEIAVKGVSPLYESDALLLEGAPESWNQPFLNLAVRITTTLEPLILLAKIKQLEQAMGRLQGPRWSPRVIDIDILAWGDLDYRSERLTIPHLGLLDRPFALWPLADLAPFWRYPVAAKSETGQTAKELIKKFGSRFDGLAPLHARQIPHRVDTPVVIGILNLTPDSFSDGGAYVNPEQAWQQAEELAAAGAEIIEIGGVSTRPGSEQVTAAEEWRRIQPVLDLWCANGINWRFKPKLGVDTYRPEIVEHLLTYPVDFFNDVSGLADARMRDLLRKSTAKVIFMHNLGIPADPARILPDSSAPIKQVYDWGRARRDSLVASGIDPQRLIFDVGIGFGKDAEQSIDLMKNIQQFRELGMPLLVGHSRKSFLNRFTARPFAERDIESATWSLFLADQLVDYLRVHNVDFTLRALKIHTSNAK